jgi:hypothetical protein
MADSFIYPLWLGYHTFPPVAIKSIFAISTKVLEVGANKFLTRPSLQSPVPAKTGQSA